MSRNWLSMAKKTFRSFWEKSKRDEHLERLYTREGYLDAYSEHTNIRVERDPHDGSGRNVGRDRKTSVRFSRK